MDSTKMEAVLKGNAQKKPIEIQSFLELTVYYRQFIKNFSKTAKPLTELTQKQGKFIWDCKCEDGFQELKKCLIEAPVLALPSEEMVWWFIQMLQRMVQNVY